MPVDHTKRLSMSASKNGKTINTRMQKACTSGARLEGTVLKSLSFYS